MTQASPIPIANIYFMYCYAWERFNEGKALASGAEASPDLPNLLARVLLNGMHALFRRGLDRAYEPISEELATVRGHIDLGASLRLYARNAKRLRCDYDELSHDVLHNQILKATLAKLVSSSSLEKPLAAEARRMLTRLSDVSDIRLTSNCFARVQLHKNNAFYDLLLHVAKLVFENLLPSTGGGHAFRDVLRDEKEMARVFEAFVRNFYRLEQTEYVVEPLTIHWDAVPVSVSPDDRLPQMRADVFMRSQSRQIIIDTKYYAEALQHYHGASSFRSANLYQLYSYLGNYAPHVPNGVTLDGMLLYPQVGRQLDAVYQVQAHRIAVRTVNLDLDWKAISQRLLSVL